MTDTIKVQAFAVVEVYDRRTKNTKSPEIADAEVESDCGSGYTEAMGIYSTKLKANLSISVHNTYPRKVVVPCTVTYKLSDLNNDHD